MNPSTNRDPAPEAEQDAAARRRPTAAVVPFPGAATRRFRREPEADEPRGRILLFTGVRYERLPDPAPAPALPKRRRS